MKKSLILLLVAIAGHAFGANPNMVDPYYIIKDGKVQSGITYPQGEYNLVLTESDSCLSVSKTGMYQNSVSFSIPATNPALHLNGRYLVMEYKLEENVLCDADHMDNYYHEITVKKDDPLVEVSAYKMVINKEDGYGLPLSTVRIDGKFNKNTIVDYVRSEHYSYARKNDAIGMVTLSFAATSADCRSTMKIKNLYYAKSDSEMQPFFSCDFYSPACVNSSVGRINPKSSPYWSYYIVYNDRRSPVFLSKMTSELDFNWTGTDGSSYLISELLHGLSVRNAKLERKMQPTDSIIIQDIALPKNAGKMQVEFLTRISYVYDSSWVKAKIPVYAKFDNAKSSVQLFNDTLPMVYEKRVAEVPVPAGAKSVSLYFLQSENSDYIVDNLILSCPASALKASSQKGTAPKKNGAKTQKPGEAVRKK